MEVLSIELMREERISVCCAADWLPMIAEQCEKLKLLFIAVFSRVSFASWIR